MYATDQFFYQFIGRSVVSIWGKIYLFVLLLYVTYYYLLFQLGKEYMVVHHIILAKLEL